MTAYRYSIVLWNMNFTKISLSVVHKIELLSELFPASTPIHVYIYIYIEISYSPSPD